MKIIPYLGIILLFLLGCSKNASENTEKIPSLKEQEIETGNPIMPEKNKDTTTKYILIFGNSLTAGYGLDNPEDGFAGLLQHRLDSLKLPYEVVNGGISGETSADGKGRIAWMMQQQVDIFVLELGANDGLRGISTEATFDNLQFILSAVKETHPEARLLITGMEVPPNMGDTYAADFRKIFPTLAEKYGAVLMPFLLEGVAGEPELNLTDGIHPTEEGHKIVAENLWKILKEMIDELN